VTYQVARKPRPVGGVFAGAGRSEQDDVGSFGEERSGG
jgi:hypothetical protein